MPAVVRQAGPIRTGGGSDIPPRDALAEGGDGDEHTLYGAPPAGQQGRVRKRGCGGGGTPGGGEEAGPVHATCASRKEGARPLAAAGPGRRHPGCWSNDKNEEEACSWPSARICQESAHGPVGKRSERARRDGDGKGGRAERTRRPPGGGRACDGTPARCSSKQASPRSNGGLYRGVLFIDGRILPWC